METGDFRLNMAPFNLKKFMDGLHEIFRPMTTQKQLFFDLKIENEIPAVIEQD